MTSSKSRLWIGSTIDRWMATVLLVFFQIGLSGAALAQSGVVAWKEQPFHADSSAKVYYFERMERTGPITWFFRGSKRMGFEPHQDFEVVLMPGSFAELNSGIGSEQLKEDFDRLSSFAKKYPAAGTLLKKRLEQMAMHLKNYEAATVKTSSERMPAAEYDKIITEKRKSEAAQPLKHNNRIMFYVVCAVYLLVLLAFTLLRKRTPVLLLLIFPFIATFAWFTYKDQGFGWVKRMNEELREAYQGLGLP